MSRAAEGSHGHLTVPESSPLGTVLRVLHLRRIPSAVVVGDDGTPLGVIVDPDHAPPHAAPEGHVVRAVRLRELLPGALSPSADLAG